MRSKITVLEEALTGHFEDHHGFLARAMLDHIDALTGRIDTISTRIEAVIAPLPATLSVSTRSPVSV